ncbi:hypothetical protein RhiirC2_751005, partial [Rhizophagus irregularis]
GREEEIYILREIMLDFIKVMDQKSQVLIGKKGFGNYYVEYTTIISTRLQIRKNII